ncbi:MAG: phasin family protein [Telluria sp.]
MFPFSHSVTPAVRSHLDAQMSFFNDMSKSLSRSFQNLCELNIQLSQTMLEESNIAGQQLLTIHNPTDAINVAASRAQPAADKLRAYQQHVSRVVADSQSELARVTEQHAPIASRTARDLADQVAHAAAEETEKGQAKQQEIMKSFRDPFEKHGAARQNGSMGAHGNMQSGAYGSNDHVEADGKRTGAAVHGNESTAKGGSKQN